MKFFLTCIAMAFLVSFVMVCLYKLDDDTIELSDDEFEKKRDELIKRQDKDINLDKED